MAKDKKRGKSRYRAKMEKREHLAKRLKSQGIQTFTVSATKGKRVPLPLPMLQALKTEQEAIVK